MQALRRTARALATLAASMRVRLTLWYLAILALVFLVFSGILVTVAQQNESFAQHADLANEAQQLASAYDPATGQINPTTLVPELKTPPTPDTTKAQAIAAPNYPLGFQGVALLVNPQGEVVQVIGSLTRRGVVELQAFLLEGVQPQASVSATKQSATNRLGASAYDTLPLPVTVADGETKTLAYVAYRTIVTSRGHLVGALAVAAPDTLNQTAQSVIPALLLAGPVTLVVAALGGYWLASRALRPVRLITRAAQQISETDLSARLRLKRRDELGELAATFDHMLTRLEAAFQRQRQFTADASHELRTPLTIINLEVTRALAQRRTPEEYEQALGIIQAENLAMSRLVGDLLTLARADASPLQLRLAPVDLSDVTLEAVERLAPLARQRGVAMVVEALPEIRLMGDRAALTQALVNLVENGVKYTAGVGSRVRVTTYYESTREGDAWAVARIVDDGPGIAPEHLPHLFDRFYRADTARAADSQEGQHSGAAVSDLARDGHGLGLAIAQWVAQAHGGGLEAQSAAGAGASFELRLPALAEAGKQKPLAEESSRGAG